MTTTEINQTMREATQEIYRLQRINGALVDAIKTVMKEIPMPSGLSNNWVWEKMDAALKLAEGRTK